MRWRFLGSFRAPGSRRLLPIRLGLERLEARLVQSASSSSPGPVESSPGVVEHPSFSFISHNPSTGVAVYDSYNNSSSSPWELVGG
jgi:hypothetical protein